MKRFGSECAIKEQNGPNKKKKGAAPSRLFPPRISAGQISGSINRWHKAPPVKTTHPDAERKAQYISFSYHGGVIVSARLTVSAIWPATVEMQSEAAAATQTGICCWQVNSNAIHIEVVVFSCHLNQSSCSIDGHVKSRAHF